MKRHLHLLMIDPQNDFCDLPAAYLADGQHAPALPVAGAHADMQRVAQLIKDGMQGLTGISMTLDSHHRIDIAHPTFWQEASGKMPAPFTQISAADVRAGVFAPRQEEHFARALAYLDALERAGRYQLMIWPVHCEIGSWGHNVHADVRVAYNQWEDLSLRSVHKISKGDNPWTEHYSAVMAEVPDAHDAGTQLNRQLIDALEQADQVYITGEAGSHCVKATTEDIVANIRPDHASRLVLLTDCMSPVSGFDAQYQDFVRDMAARGVQIAKAADVLPDLLANGRR